MPTYSYVCNKCGKKFDRFQQMKDEPIQICENEGCGGDVKRLIGTGAGAILKGTGYYQTDFKNSGNKNSKNEACGACPNAESCPSGDKK